MRERGLSNGSVGPDVTSFESTLPPTSKKDLLAADGATILVFSHDAGLATVIKNVAGNHYPIRVIDEWRDVLQLVGSGGGRIVLVDVDALNKSVDESLADLNRCADWLVTIIAAKQQQAQDFMRFWSERRIHRLLIKPAAVGITRLLLESAIGRFMELRELHENTDAMEILPGLLEEDQPRPNWLKLGLVAAAVLAVGIVGYAMVTSGEDESAVARSPVRSDATADNLERTPVARQAPAPLDSASGEIEDPYAGLIEQAEQAARDGRVIAPRGDNALEYYVTVLAEAPDHAVARANLNELLEELFLHAEASLLAGDLDAVEATLEHIRLGAPTSSRLRFLSEQLAQTRARNAAVVAANRSAVAAGSTGRGTEPPNNDAPAAEPLSEVQSMLMLGRLRLSQGALIAPSGDSARDYLLRAADIEADNDELTTLQAALAAEAASAAPVAFSAGDFDQASDLLEAALAFGATSPEMETLRADIVAARAARAQQEMSALGTRATAQIDNARLTGERDSAFATLQKMRALDSGSVLVAEVESKLRAALIAGAEQSIASAQFALAREFLSTLDDGLQAQQASAALMRALAHAERQATYLEETSPVGSMKIRSAEAPTYPRDALVAEITGWVDLNFTVDEQGVTRDIVVVAAEPPDRFDDAAIEAVSRYEFEPFVEDGELYARRIRARVRFQLN